MKRSKVEYSSKQFLVVHTWVQREHSELFHIYRAYYKKRFLFIFFRPILIEEWSSLI